MGDPHLALSRIHTKAGVLNRHVLNRSGGSTARKWCYSVKNSAVKQRGRAQKKGPPDIAPKSFSQKGPKWCSVLSIGVIGKSALEIGHFLRPNFWMISGGPPSPGPFVSLLKNPLLNKHEQKRDRGRDSQPRPRLRLNSQPQGATNKPPFGECRKRPRTAANFVGNYHYTIVAQCSATPPVARHLFRGNLTCDTPGS